MIKKTLLILAFPFKLLYYVVVTPFKIAGLVLKIIGLIIVDIIKRPAKKQTAKKAKATDLLEMGGLLFTNYKNEFETYYRLYLTDKNKFHTTYPIDLPDDRKELTPIEAFQAFADDKQIAAHLDWRGEDDVYEIEEFIALQIEKPPLWTNTIMLRTAVPINRQRDGKFIVKLFQAIDKDLQTINFRLLFLDMGWDAYVFLPATAVVFDKVLEKAPNYFQRVEEL